MSSERVTAVVDVLAILFSPSWWFRNHPTSAALSEFINERLDAGEIPVIECDYRMRLGGVSLWRKNFPYAYGELWGDGLDSRRMPSRRVVRRLRRAELQALPNAELAIRAHIAKATGEPT